MAKPDRLAYHSAMQDFFRSDTAFAAPPAKAARFDEDLPTMAAQAFALAKHHCSHCQVHHSIFPYLRLARMCGGADSGAAAIERTLRRLLARDGHRRVLIAGAADSGLLAMVARAGAELEPDITLVDRCETPLEINRRFAARWSIPVRIQRLDLNELDLQGFDIVYANSLLQFIAEERRVDVLARMRRALRPGGHLVCVDNAGRRIDGDVVPEYRGSYVDWLMAELEREGIPFPDSREAFRRLVSDYSTQRRTIEGVFERPEVIDDMIAKAGFVVKSREQLAMPLTDSYQTFVAKLSKRRFLSVAQSPVP